MVNLGIEEWEKATQEIFMPAMDEYFADVSNYIHDNNITTIVDEGLHALCSERAAETAKVIDQKFHDTITPDDEEIYPYFRSEMTSDAKPRVFSDLERIAALPHDVWNIALYYLPYIDREEIEETLSIPVLSRDIPGAVRTLAINALVETVRYLLAYEDDIAPISAFKVLYGVAYNEYDRTLRRYSTATPEAQDAYYSRKVFSFLNEEDAKDVVQAAAWQLYDEFRFDTQKTLDLVLSIVLDIHGDSTSVRNWLSGKFIKEVCQHES